MKILIGMLLAVGLLAQAPAPSPQQGGGSTGGGGGAPTGPAGGVLSGTYPDPGVANSINLPGVPTAPTAAPAANSTQLATTAYADAAAAARAPAATVAQFTTVTFSATPTFSCTSTTSDTFKITLTGNITSSTLSGCTTGEKVTILYYQDGTGSRTNVYPGNVIGGCTINGTLSTYTQVVGTYDGTNDNVQSCFTTAPNTTGSGLYVLQTSPTLITPAIGVATATTLNKITLTPPATGSTLTLPDGTTATGPATSDTLVGRASTDTLTNKTFDTGGTGNSLKIAGTAITAVSGIGAVCLVTGSACSGGGSAAGTSVTSTTPVTVNANSTGEQFLMELPLGAGYLNNLGQPFLINGAFVYTTPAAQTPTITITARLCAVTVCGSGTNRVLATVVSTATLASVTNNTINFSLMAINHATGASGTLEVHGPLSIDLGALTTTADSIFNDVNTAVTGTIDMTAALFVDFTVTFSTNAVGANSITQRSGGIMPFAATAAGADAALDNLTTTSINQALLPQSGKALGSTAANWNDLFLNLSGTFGTGYVHFVGTPTAARTITVPDSNAVTPQVKDCTGTPSEAIAKLNADGTVTCSLALGTVYNNAINGTIASATTQFAVIGGANGFNATESVRQNVMPRAGVFQYFYLRTSTAQPNSGSASTCSLRNSTTTTTSAVTVTLGVNDAAQTYSDTTHTMAASAGDLVTLTCTNNFGATSGSVLAISAMFFPN